MMEARMTAVPGSGGVSGRKPKIRIIVWLFDPATYHPLGQPDIAVTAAAEFNQAHPEYLVEIRFHGFRTIAEEVARAAEQGEPPDVAEYHYSVTRPALDSLRCDGTPLFTPVERAIAGRTEILGEPVVLGDMVPAARDHFRYAGELTSTVRSASTVLLYANMSILAKAGIAEPPRTWREVTAACRAVTELSGGPAHGITWPNCYWWFLQAVAQQGGLIADRDNGRRLERDAGLCQVVGAPPPGRLLPLYRKTRGL
jgi:sn-glycerol 3-phosphate transport system substrate-binding protein